MVNNGIISVEDIAREIENTHKKRINSDDLNQIVNMIQNSKLRFPLNKFKLDDLSNKAKQVESDNDFDKQEGHEALKELESLLVTNLKDIKPTRVQIKINGQTQPKVETKPEPKTETKKPTTSQQNQSIEAKKADARIVTGKQIGRAHV